MNSANRRSAIFIRAVCLVCCALFIFCSPCHARTSQTKLSSIILSHKDQWLTCRVDIEGIFEEKITQAIFSGIPVSFTFHINLYEDISLWHDKKMIAVEAVHTIKYNTLKNDFTVTRVCNENKWPTTVHSFEEAQRLMRQTRELNITALQTLTRGSSYKIKVMAEMNKSEQPFYRYLLFFINFNDFKTKWHTIKFTY